VVLDDDEELVVVDWVEAVELVELLDELVDVVVL